MTDLRRKDKTFVDISLSFIPNPLNGDLTTIKDERAINNSIKNLILTRPNEVPFQRDIGSNVTALLFEFNDGSTADLIEQEIVRTIKFSEPRVEIQEVKVENDPDTYKFLATVKYKIVGRETIFTVQQILTPTR